MNEPRTMTVSGRSPYCGHTTWVAEHSYDNVCAEAHRLHQALAEAYQELEDYGHQRAASNTHQELKKTPKPLAEGTWGVSKQQASRQPEAEKDVAAGGGFSRLVPPPAPRRDRGSMWDDPMPVGNYPNSVVTMSMASELADAGLPLIAALARKYAVDRPRHRDLWGWFRKWH